MIDWTRIDELKEEIGSDGFAEVADMFLQEAEEAVRALAGPLRVDEVEAQLHFLKGSALNLGLTELASICHTGERLAASGKKHAFDPAQIVAVYHASRAQLLSGIAAGSAA